MASNQVRFSCTALAGTSRAGSLKPDEQGYYTTPVGALNVLNSIGQLYVYEEAKNLFEASSSFMRRVKRGVLAGESGHPKWIPGMTEDQYAQRIMAIYEDNICCHHREIYLDFDNVKDANGQPVIAIMSKLRPAGPHGEALRQSLENQHENVCFSIRAFTDDFRDHQRGLTKRILRSIVTWDRVLEPGIAVAEKYKSPSLESLEDRNLSRGVLERAVLQQPVGVAQESAILTANELFKSMGWSAPQGARPDFLSW